MSRLYVLVDQKLPLGYQAAQAGHAVAQWIYDNPNDSWKNNYLIMLQGDVEKWKKKLTYKQIKFSEFQEPDLNDQTTALALLHNGDLFKKLKLVGK